MVEGQREKIPNGQTEIRRLKTRVGGSVALEDEGLDCTVEVYMLEESEEEVAVLRVGTQQGEAPRVRAVKSSKFGEGKL